LLFVDVLAFRQYLIHGTIPEKYLKKIEETKSVVNNALSSVTEEMLKKEYPLLVFETKT